MEAEWQARTELLVGAEGVALLREAHVLVVGLGGVGAMAAEVLARAGVGSMTIADGDRVQPTNLNRQLVALHSTLGHSKAEATAQRLLDINPELKVRVVGEFLKGQPLVDLAREPYSVVVDAIDTLSPKVFLIVEAVGAGNRVVSAMGCGGKLRCKRVASGVREIAGWQAPCESECGIWGSGLIFVRSTLPNFPGPKAWCIARKSRIGRVGWE